MWIWLVLLYGIFKGFREICKKKAMEISSPIEVLLVYSFISFVLVVPDVKNAMGMPLKFYGFIAIKAFVIFAAWLLSFYAIKKLPLSLFGVLDLSRVLFATFLGITFLGEKMSYLQIAGFILVCVGLLSLRFKPEMFRKAINKKNEISNNSDVLFVQKNQISENAGKNKNISTSVFVIMAFLSCALNAVSGFLDKVLMKDINSSQLQFWYMLFLVLFYLIFVLITRQKIDVKKTIKNKWVWILSILFVVADRALFLANGMPESKITVMTLIKQSGCIVTILGGRFIFKEKNIAHKLVCACIIILGIVLGVMK